MSHCVPSWDNLDENPRSPRLDYQVAELTWENGQPAMHGLGLPRVPSGLLKATSSHATAKYTNNWEKGGGTSGGGGGTLESIVNQATTTTTTGQHKSTVTGCEGGGDDLLTWFVVPPSSGTATMAMDALVPCSKIHNNNDNNNNNNNLSSHVLDPAQAVGTRVGGTSTHVGSCSGVRNVKLARVVGGDMASHDWTSRAELSVSNSGTCVKEYSRQVTFDTAGFTSTSTGSPENTSSGMQFTNKTADDDHDDSVCHGGTQSEIGEEAVKKKGTGKGSVSTKRSRAAAIHNQSERKRRDKINQRMKTLQKMIPNSSKSDKASMLDEVIEYLKQLQAQVSMVSRMNMPQMMLPLAIQQQQQMQMAMMGAPMGMGLPGLGMGMGFMDMNTMGHNNIPGMPPVLHPSAFMQPMTPWDGSGGGDNRLPSSGSPAIHDPLTSFLACQSQQPMTMDAYTRMATMFQQFQQLPGGPSTKN